MDALELDEWITTLEADAADHRAALEVIDQRLPILRDLRATFDTPVVEPQPPTSAIKATPSKPAAKPTTSATFPCEVAGCGRVFEKPHGLLVHTKRSHKVVSAPSSAPARPQLAPVPPIATPNSVGAPSRTVYRCGSDDLEFPTIVDLTHHCLTAHDRRPTAGEKILVTPDSARSSA